MPTRQSKTVDVAIPLKPKEAKEWLRQHAIPYSHMRSRGHGGWTAFRIRRGYLLDFQHQANKLALRVFGFAENPRKNVSDVFRSWLVKKAKRGESISTDGNTIWSYKTWLVDRRANGDVLFNATHYSHTTTVQQNGLRVLLGMEGVEWKEVDDVPRGSLYASTSFGASMKNPRKTRENPPLVTFGNPSRLLSRSVVDIRYKHAEDGQYYHHKFKAGQVEIRGDANGKTAVLRRVDGKPLLKEY